MCWDCYDNPKGDPYKNYIRGGVEIDDFDKEVNYQTRLKKKRKKKTEKVKNRPGCPENDYGPHVYVWTSETYNSENSLFVRVFGWSKWEEKICCGCRKRANKHRLTDRYEKVKKRKYEKAYGDGSNQPRGEPVPRYNWRARKTNYDYWSWEEYDAAYSAVYEKVKEKHGGSLYFAGYRDRWGY